MSQISIDAPLAYQPLSRSADAGLRAGTDIVAPPAGPIPVPPSTDELIDLIKLRYHHVHRRELPELIRLAKRVERAHSAHPANPRGIVALLEQMRGELEAHMLKEESVLFPMMRRGGHPLIAQPIGAMLVEHDDHSELLRELERITGYFAVPDDACPTWRALYAGARRFADNVAEHIHMENDILFPRFGG